MNLIYIFYALIVEEKNKELKMHGPFIHHNQAEINKAGWPAYIFNKDDYQNERKFLSKFLRTKNPNKLSIFHCIDIDKTSIDLTCKCGHKMTLDIVDCNNDFICPKCNTNDALESLVKIGDDHRQASLLKAFEYFDKRFKQMSENYDICNRKR